MALRDGHVQGAAVVRGGGFQVDSGRRSQDGDRLQPVQFVSAQQGGDIVTLQGDVGVGPVADGVRRQVAQAGQVARLNRLAQVVLKENDSDFGVGRRRRIAFGVGFESGGVPRHIAEDIVQRGFVVRVLGVGFRGPRRNQRPDDIGAGEMRRLVQKQPAVVVARAGVGAVFNQQVHHVNHAGLGVVGANRNHQGDFAQVVDEVGVRLD